MLTFKQSAWLKPYIDFNTGRRAKATSNFEKDLYKLMNNAVFGKLKFTIELKYYSLFSGISNYLFFYFIFYFLGKTQENLRNRISVEVITDRQKALKRVCKPSFKRSQTLHENLTIIRSSIRNLILNKPVYVGFSVLDLSKLWMYQFHYTVIMDKYGENASLCFTDTDSLLYQIKTNNVFKDMMENHNLFDLSNYVDNHEIFYGKTREEIKFLKNENKKLIGKFKDEVGGIILEEFIGLRPKCYSILYGWLQKQIAKGVKETVKKVHLRHDDYIEVRENLSILYLSQNTINSKNHQLHSIHQTRTA